MGHKGAAFQLLLDPPRTFFATEFSKNIDLADQTHLEDGLKCKKNTLGLQFNAAEWLREYIGMH